MIDTQKIEQDWASRGFSFGLFTDPPGQRWEGYVHAVDELWQLGHGEIELEIDGVVLYPKVGEEVLIKAHQVHSVRNIGATYAHWFYGYPKD